MYRSPQHRYNRYQQGTSLDIHPPAFTSLICCRQHPHQDGVALGLGLRSWPQQDGIVRQHLQAEQERGWQDSRDEQYAEATNVSIDGVPLRQEAERQHSKNAKKVKFGYFASQPLLPYVVLAQSLLQKDI